MIARRLAICAGAALGLTLAAPPSGAAASPVDAAEGFFATLSAKEAQAARLGFGDAARRRWRLTPSRRAGLPFKAMDAETRAAAEAFFASALSPQGVDLVALVRERERILGERTGRPGYRDPELYYLAIFGSPNRRAALWGWRLEGHHLSLNFTYEGENLRSALPMAYGSNPERPGGPDTAMLSPLREIVAARAGRDLAARTEALQAILSPAPEPFRTRFAERYAARGALADGVDRGDVLRATGGRARFVHEWVDDDHIHVTFESEIDDFGGVK